MNLGYSAFEDPRKLFIFDPFEDSPMGYPVEIDIEDGVCQIQLPVSINKFRDYKPPITIGLSDIIKGLEKDFDIMNKPLKILKEFMRVHNLSLDMDISIDGGNELLMITIVESVTVIDLWETLLEKDG